MWASYFSSLGLTLLVEVPIYCLALVTALGVRPGPAIVAGTAVNLVSHPIGFLAIGPAIRSSIGITGALVAVESTAVLVEWGLLLGWIKREPILLILIGIVANGASFLAGVALLR